MRLMGLYEQTKKNFDFFEGRQWEGLISGDYNPPCENVIKQIVRHKYNTIAMQDVEIIFTSSNSNGEMVTRALNSYMEQFWEEKKMYSKMWRANKESHIAGDGYLYFYDDGGKESSKISCHLIDNLNIYFENEREPDIQNQEYIIISQRLEAKKVKDKALAKGIEKELIDLIVPDSETEYKSKPFEDSAQNKKVTVLTYFYMEDGELHFINCTRNVILERENTKLTLYPIAKLICNERKGSARGLGEVAPLIDNQIEINKTLWRRGVSIKNVAFPIKVVNESYISNPQALEKAGSTIYAKGGNVSELVKYISPSHIGGDAKNYTDELIMLTKELNNSGDGATGQIDPTKASGVAVQAVTQQSNVSMSEQMANYKQFVEDCGYIILDFLKTYNPDGLEIETDEGIQVVSSEKIKKVKLKINISQATPFNKWAVETELKGLFQAGVITFEEYVSSLDENSLTPKNKLQKIIDLRGENQKKDAIINKLLEIISKFKMNDVTSKALNSEEKLEEGEI